MDDGYRVVLGAFMTDHRQVMETTHLLDTARLLARAYAIAYLGNAAASRVTVEAQDSPRDGIVWALELTLARDGAGIVHVVERAAGERWSGPCLAATSGVPFPGPVELTVATPVSCPTCQGFASGFAPAPAARQRWKSRDGRRELVVLNLVEKDDVLGPFTFARCAVYIEGRLRGREELVPVDRLRTARNRLYSFQGIVRPDPRLSDRLAPFRYGIRLSRDPERWLAEAWDPLACNEGPLWCPTPRWTEDDQRELWMHPAEVVKASARADVIALATSFKEEPEVVVVFPSQ